MYEIYLYNDTDRCLAPVCYDDLNDALHQVLHFVQAVPRILVTNNQGASVFESKMGRIIFPENRLDTTLDSVVQHIFDETKLYHVVDMISKLHHLVLCMLRDNTPNRQTLKSQINHLDLYIQGFGAATSSNIYHLGYNKPDVMFEEWSVANKLYSVGG